MSFKIIYTVSFEKEFKRLSSKYPSLKSDFKTLLISLHENPKQGDALGNNCYKVRIAIASKGKGKSGGSQSNYLRKNCGRTYFPCKHLR